jgi:hypothetical protein
MSRAMRKPRPAFERVAANPERENIIDRLHAVQAEQSALFLKQRKHGLTVNEHRRLAELSREEIALMQSKRDTGRRLLGARHHQR